MPQLPMNYKKSVIYKLCCKDVSITDCYVGSTTSFNKRKSAHKCVCNNVKNKCHNLNVYQFIRDHGGGWQNWDMIVVESFPCESKNELHTRERYWLESLNATLNKRIPTRSGKEWSEDNAEKLKKYRQTNCERHKETLRIWNEKNVEKIKEDKRIYQKKHSEKLKEYQRIYNKNNYESLNKKRREYQQNNSESISERRKEKIPCPHCDKMLRRDSMKKHIKTQHP